MQLTGHSQTKRALGGDVTLNFVCQSSLIDVDLLFAKLWRRVYEFERRFSRFLESSELSNFNKKAGIKVAISSQLKNILTASLRLSKETDGLYNPFVLPALQRAGYLNSALESYTDDKAPDYTQRQVVGWDELVIGDDWALIPYGSAIDLGGCGKGYLADELGQLLVAQNVTGYWLELSGDIATYGTDEIGDPICVAIQSATDSGHSLDNLMVETPTEMFAVATSGTFKRATQTSIKKHHIIDPSTGKPAETDIVLATVCASSALEADVLASCAVILGSEKAPNFLQKFSTPSWFLQYTRNNVVEQEQFGPNIINRTVEDKNA